jgi:hypothetical protein
MRLFIHPPQKNGVMRVTGVTPICNLLNLKGLSQVTRRNAQRYTTCYVVESCNNICPATSLLVEEDRVVNRGIHDAKRGQGAVNGR